MKSLLLSLLLVPAIAFAADGSKPRKPGKAGEKPGHNPESVFKKLDTNTDGNLSLDEFKASPRAQKHADKAETRYRKVDKDSDGKLTLEEFKSHLPKKAGKRGGKSKPDVPKAEIPAPDAPKTEV